MKAGTGIAAVAEKVPFKLKLLVTPGTNAVPLAKVIRTGSAGVPLFGAVAEPLPRLLKSIVFHAISTISSD
jgi:hypothetical protein